MITITISSWMGVIWFIMLCTGGLMLGEFLLGLIKGYEKRKTIHIKFISGGVMINASSDELAKIGGEIIQKIEEKLNNKEKKR